MSKSIRQGGLATCNLDLVGASSLDDHDLAIQETIFIVDTMNLLDEVRGGNIPSLAAGTGVPATVVEGLSDFGASRTLQKTRVLLWL